MARTSCTQCCIGSLSTLEYSVNFTGWRVQLAPALSQAMRETKCDCAQARILHWHSHVIKFWPCPTEANFLARALHKSLFLRRKWSRLYVNGKPREWENKESGNDGFLVETDNITIAVHFPAEFAFQDLSSWRSNLLLDDLPFGPQISKDVNCQTVPTLNTLQHTQEKKFSERGVTSSQISSSLDLQPVEVYFLAPYGCLDCKYNHFVYRCTTLTELVETYCQLYGLQTTSLVTVRRAGELPPIIWLVDEEQTATSNQKGVVRLTTDILDLETIMPSKENQLIVACRSEDSDLVQTDEGFIRIERIGRLKRDNVLSNVTKVHRGKSLKREPSARDPLAVLEQRPKKVSMLLKSLVTKGGSFEATTSRFKCITDKDLQIERQTKALGRGYSRFSPIPVTSAESNEGGYENPIVID